MNGFATYDKDASSLEDPTRFWAEVEEILHIEPTHDETRSISSPLQTRLTNFYALCDACYDAHLDQPYNSDYLLGRLIESPLITTVSREECANLLTRMTIEVTSLPTLALIYDTLLKLASRQAGLFRTAHAARQLIPRLVHHFWAARYAEEVNDKRGSSMPLAPRLGGGGGQEHAGWSGADWNIRHVRSTSLGDHKRQSLEQRNRSLQIRLRERALRVMYEVCRSQRLTSSDMRPIDATFVNHLFELVEQSRNWEDDSYNYQLIMLIVALNEQFMVSGVSAALSKPSARKSTANASNTVMTVLRTRLNASKTFGQNLIFMLNRASSLDVDDACMQLLVLKLLYLLFTTKETAHYFYTNDLKVLVDIFIRELSDLPEDNEALRHTYLRVLHPLLTNTQLLSYPYKRTQIRRLLVGLTAHGHLRDISLTTTQLVDRCLSAQWCVDLEQAASTTVSHGESGTERKHTLTIQAIGGGPARRVQAQVFVDSEGVKVPVGADHEPIYGSSYSVTESLTIAAQSSATDTLQPTVDSRITPVTVDAADDHSSATPSTTPKMRTTRVYSMDAQSVPRMRPFMNEHAASASVHDGITSSAPLGSATSDSDSELRLSATAPSGDRTIPCPDVSESGARLQPRYERAKPAKDPSSMSAPKRAHSAMDVRRLGSTEADSEDESDQWTGSPSTSWHQSMTDEGDVTGTMAATPQSGPRAGIVSALPASPLRDSPLSGRTVAHSAKPAHSMLAVIDIPSLHVQAASGDDTPELGSSTEETGMQSGRGLTTRRPPPAPPTLDKGGPVRGLQFRKLGLHLSPSESSLVCPRTTEDVGTNQPRERQRLLGADTRRGSTGHVRAAMSRPGSPGRSRDSSRTASPQPSDGHIRVGGGRRRPPPPPIDRSKKSTQTIAAVGVCECSKGDSCSGEARAACQARAPDEKEEEEQGDSLHLETERAPQHDHIHDETSPKRHLSSYMRHLHLTSEGGYGW